MTTTTPDTVASPTAEPRRTRCASGSASRSSSAWSLAHRRCGVGALYAYDQQYVGRVLPGVRVGAVDLSGLDAAAAARPARRRLRRAAARASSVVPGRMATARSPTPRSAAGPMSTPMRRPRPWPSAAAATPVERVIAGRPDRRARRDARARASPSTPTRSPSASWPRDAALEAAVRCLGRDRRQDRSSWSSPGSDGRAADADRAPTRGLLADARRLDAPATLDGRRCRRRRRAGHHDGRGDQRQGGRGARSRPASRSAVDEDEHRRSRPTRIRGWVTFADTVTAATARRSTRPSSRASSRRSPRRSTRRRSTHVQDAGGRITGVIPSQDGYKIGRRPATAASGPGAPRRPHRRGRDRPARADGQGHRARADDRRGQGARPKMRKISSWTTTSRSARRTASARTSGSRPASSTATSSRRGRTSTSGMPSGRSPGPRATSHGGAIINGRTEPQGALAGGICSCSTTLFNAALRAGYEMGARRNHYYYIDRYPLGLDATVFISALGLEADDVVHERHRLPGPHPRLQDTGTAGTGYVKFELYSVPNGRKVSSSAGRSSRTCRHATRHGPVHVHACAPGVRQAHRVPGRRQAGLGDADRRGPGRQGHPPRHVLLELRADHRDHADRQEARRPRARSTPHLKARLRGTGDRISPPPARSDGAGPAAMTASAGTLSARSRRPWAIASASSRVDPEPAQRVARHLDRELALTVDRLDLGADRPELRGLVVARGCGPRSRSPG